MSGARGFTLVEMLVSITLVLLCLTGLMAMTVENSRINRAQQMTSQVQANARNTMSIIVPKLRSAGWDPMNVGLGGVNLDADLSDEISEIEIFADLDEDGTTDGLDEQVLIRHDADQVVWRRTNDASDPFIVIATDITNDADGDGVIEPMFIAVSADRILVQITAESPVPDPMTGQFIRYTVRNEVALRKAL